MYHVYVLNQYSKSRNNSVKSVEADESNVNILAVVGRNRKMGLFPNVSLKPLKSTTILLP